MTQKFARRLMVVAGLALLALPVRAFAYDNYYHGGDNDRGWQQTWNRHHRAEPNELARRCYPDRNRGYEQYRPNAYAPRPNAYAPGYNYGYPSANQYGADGGLFQYRDALANRDQRMRALYDAAVAHGDRKAAKYYGGQLRNTDKQYNLTTRELGAQGTPPYAANRGFVPGVAPWSQRAFGN